MAGEPYSRFPVYQQSYDDVIGFIHVRDLIDPQFTSRQLTVGEISRPVKLLPMSKTVLSALSEMRRDRFHLAIVMDEYGGTAGIVTLEDLVEELVGDIQDEYDVDEGQPKQLRGGAIEVDGLLNLDDFAEQTGIELPEGPYETVAGYMLAMLGQLPTGHEAVEIGGHRLTVLAMDGRRIARVRVDPAEPDGDASAQDGAPASRDGVIPSLAAPTAPAAPPAAPAAPPATPEAPPASGAPPAASAPDGLGGPRSPTKPGNLSRPVTQVVIKGLVALQRHQSHDHAEARAGAGGGARGAAHLVRRAATRLLDLRFSRGRRWRAAQSGL